MFLLSCFYGSIGTLCLMVVSYWTSLPLVIPPQVHSRYRHHITLSKALFSSFHSPAQNPTGTPFDFLSGIYGLLQSESHIFSCLICLPVLVPRANQSALLTTTEHTVWFPRNTFTLSAYSTPSPFLSSKVRAQMISRRLLIVSSICSLLLL